MRNATFLLVLIVPIAFAACNGRSYKASASNMEGTIKTGSRFYVTKADKFDHNDIVVFDRMGEDYAAPPGEDGKFNKKRQQYVHRIIAVSGDSITIIDSDVFIDGRKIALPPNAWIQYEIEAKKELTDLPEMEELSPGFLPSVQGNVYSVFFSEEQALNYKKQHAADIYDMRKRRDSANTDALARSTIYDRWSATDYGPLYIPKPGDVVEVNEVNFALYQNIANIHMGRNTISEKLYFVMGDNRMASEDSRYIGFIPQSNMYGVVK